MRIIVVLAYLIIWSVLCIMAPFTLLWWSALVTGTWVAGSIALFLMLAFTATIPNTWYVRLFFLPATLVLL
jgi:hypothetical protein